MAQHKGQAQGRNVLKLAAFALFFAFFHFAYDWWPGPLTALVSGIDESVFQHAKIGYFAWIAASIVEALAAHPARASLSDWIASRLWGAGLVVGLFTVVWYLAPALYGPLPSDAIEVLWAFASILAGGAVAQALEQQLLRAPLSRFLRVLAFASAGLALFLFVRFTRERPWVDLFAPPAKPQAAVPPIRP